MDFDPTLLRAFVAVKEYGGFTRAAERLNLTQSAVSHQIRRLEEQVGRPLLHRTTRRLRLTEDGEDFLRHAQQILRSLDALAQRFQPSPIAGVVRFGAPENFMGERLPQLLCRFARAFPDVRLEVSVGLHIDLRAMIQAGELDLAVVISSPPVPGGSVLHQADFVWVAADGFEAAHGASVPLAFAPAPCVSRQVGLAALENAPIDWHIMFTSPSQQDLRAAVMSGLAVAVLTRDEVRPGLRIIDGEYGLPPLPSGEFTLIWSDNGRTPAACEFGQLIQRLELPAVSAAAHAA